MASLPPALLDTVHDRVLTGLDDLLGTDRALGEEIASRVVAYLRNTAETTVSVEEDGTTFVITGDIPAMWLRDSAAQLTPLLRLVAGGIGAEEDRAVLVSLLAGLLRRQWTYLEIDPYANAFNRLPDSSHWDEDVTEFDNPWAWERKFELDSLSYGPDLAWRLWRATGDTSWADERFLPAARAILATVAAEQDHEQRSAYRFQRAGVPAQDTLAREGRGALTAPNGLVWAGFRPSDDACELGYNIPGNHFLALALERLGQLLEEVAQAPEEAAEARQRAGEIRAALAEHGTIEGPQGERVWAYEIDGRGAHRFLDDANVPSLLALPYLGCMDESNPTYLATRAAVLSRANPYYYAGLFLEGVGSPHTPKDHVWPIAKAVEGLTTADRAEKLRLLQQMIRTDGGTGMMHEGVHVDDPTIFTREWFSWSNSMFCELALDLAGVDRDAPSEARGDADGTGAGADAAGESEADGDLRA
ncbi:glycoside hydrolase family 125 protein [Brachybacterium saurashtrense]|uniref:Glycoside hydrolase family 125 protein n=1 Tax=Brachybacterium saurashtrense TaxID=556288 RepID=A0A345YQP0_9MICO|nr:glycoside hydrolase family 125 protein [Brachybacterium saurashtrense]AXK46242.1 glycoside hydrolase family 125 protein [Brachybacterium saurashtrense]RRR23982.1 glycoside hydrolase family 125 protein [Brachybacterium saurashtrense]